MGVSCTIQAQYHEFSFLQVEQNMKKEKKLTKSYILVCLSKRNRKVIYNKENNIQQLSPQCA